jgi:hypothetical protein
MGFEKKNYLQFYNSDTNSYEELPNLASGIYLSFNEGDVTSNDPAGRVRFSGIKIPIFKTSQIVANPILIGQLIGGQGPAINIGEWQRTESPYSIRVDGDGPEIAIGSSNFLISGRENMTMGNFNMSYQSRLINIYGRANYADNSNYIWMLGSANYVSGIYLSNILGKNNNIYAGNNLEPLRLQYPKVYSGYQTFMLNVIGDYNSIISGGQELNIVGNYNGLTESYFINCFGAYNSSYLSSGVNNLILGNSNGLDRSFSSVVMGIENSLSLSTGDFILGKRNNINSSYSNYIFGMSNSLSDSAVSNKIYGDTNQIKGSYNQIFGTSTVNYSNSFFDIIIGNGNFLSGTYNNCILGSNNTSNTDILNEVAISYPFLATQLRTGFGGDYNFYLGNNIRGTLNDTTFSLGESNNLINNYQSYSVGRNNQLVSNQNSYVFGYDNFITGSKDSIFVGFNFASGTSTQGISGVGIKISPSGIDIYGTLRVNGVKMNVP